MFTFTSSYEQFRLLLLELSFWIKNLVKLYADRVPLVDAGAYLGVNLILTALSILLAVILVQLNACKTKVPRWLRKVSELKY